MLKKILLALISLLFIILPEIAKADGGIFPKEDNYITETNQKAVIAYDNNIETLIISTDFKGNPNDFGWVIPVPQKPEVSKSQNDLYTALANLTAPTTNNLRQIPALGFGETSTKTPLAVDIIETKKIDIYDISIVTSENSADLTTWLTENDYKIPENASSILNEYINNKWFFICTKIDLTKISEDNKNQLATGHATPLKIQFQSDKIIYPLKLSSIIAEYEDLSPQKSGIKGLTSVPQVSILLYVFSDGKKEISGFDTRYANWIEKKEIEELSYDTEGKSWYSPKTSKMYLTKLYKSMKTSEMTEDLVINNASNNDVIGVSETNLFADILASIIIFALTFLLLFLSPIGIVFIIFSIMQFLAKSKTAHIILWIFQIILLLLSALISLIISLIAIRNLEFKFLIESLNQTINFQWSGIAIVIGSAVVIIAEIFILIWQYKFQKKNGLQSEDNCPQKKADNIFDNKKEKKIKLM